MKKIKSIINLYAVAMLASVTLYVVLCFPSAVFASSWSPQGLLTSFLQKNYPWDEIKVKSVKIMAEVPDEKPLRIVMEKGPIGHAVFSFFFEDGYRLLVKANVMALGSVVKSKRPFRRGHEILPEDIYLSKMDIRRMPRSTIRDPGEITGKFLKKSITANTPIVENMIENSRVVKRGRKVDLVINSGGLSIKAAGRIKQKGYVGDLVKAVNISSKKEVTGVLVDENTVEVEL